MRGLDVAVIGGGLGGLATAIALRSHGHHPTVYEQTEVFQEVGAGISLWPNGVKVMSLLGLGDQVAALGGRMDRMSYLDRHGATLTEFSLVPFYDAVGQRAWPVARSALQDLLVGAAGVDCIRFGARCEAVSATARSAVLTLADGSSVEADLVVAADGTHSPIRSWIAGEPVERQYVGYVNFNSVTDLPTGVVAPDTWATWVGDGARASVMPIGGGRHYVFFDLPLSLERSSPPEGVTPLEELQRAFAGWPEAVGELVSSLETRRVNRVLIHDLPPLEAWFKDRVVLIGDAAHAMAPDLGQGGCQALEDALVLTHYLTTTDVSVADALRRYESERKERTAEIVRRARKRAAITHGGGEETEEWYRQLATETGEGVIAGLIESVVTGPCR